MRIALRITLLVFLLAAGAASAAGQVVDLPTRAGVTQRFLFIAASDAKASLLLFPGGHGGVQFDDGGNPRGLRNNFLVRAAPLFAAAGFNVAIIDAPSDRQSGSFLIGFRQSREHATDVAAVIAWLKKQEALPVWLVGTSRGTQSAASTAIALQGAAGPDGLVLTSTILVDRREAPVPDMRVDALKLPVLVVHHEQDECRACPPREAPRLIDKLVAVPRKELVTFRGGENRGDPCEALAYHGYNGLEADVAKRIADWIFAPTR